MNMRVMNKTYIGACVYCGCAADDLLKLKHESKLELKFDRLEVVCTVQPRGWAQRIHVDLKLPDNKTD